MKSLRLKYIFLDADDTLWENEQFFRDAEDRFSELLAPFTEGKDMRRELWDNQERNIPLFGYGSKTYFIGMVDTALTICGGSISSNIYNQIRKIIIDLAFHELQLMDGVKDTLEALSQRYNLVICTKGDLTEQLHKCHISGLEPFIHSVEVVPNKNERDYLAVAAKYEIEASDMLMVGNSVKSDIIPVINIGGTAIHISHPVTWDHEFAEMPDSERILELKSIKELKNIL